MPPDRPGVPQFLCSKGAWIVRKAVSFIMVVAVALGVCTARQVLADSQKAAKPVAVVSFAGYAELMGDLKFAGELGNHPDLDKNIEAVLKLFTKGRGLAGIDKNRPWGAVIRSGGGKPTGYAFVPVTDLEELLALLDKLGHKSKDAGDGIIEIDTKQKGKRLFVREGKGWAFFADKPEALAGTAADPAKLIAGLPQQYDWALRLNVSGVSDECREKFIECLKQRGKKCLERKKDGKKRLAVRRLIGRQILERIDTASKEIEQITIGCALDHDARTAYLEVTVTALEGTSVAKQFAELKQAKTEFAGFQLPDAAVTGGIACRRLDVNDDDVTAVFKAIRAAAFERIKDKIESEEKAERARKFVAGMLRVGAETVASGRVDRAGSLVLGPDAVTVLGGRYVADGRKLEKTLGLLVQAARKKHPDFVEKHFKPNAEEFKGVRLHVLSIPITDKCKHRDKAVGLVGKNLDVVVGIGRQSACFAAGRDALKTLKQAIAKSRAKREEVVPPLRFSVSLSRLADFGTKVADEKGRPIAEKAAALLKDSGGKDHITAVATPIERGVKYRLEFEEGALKVLAEAHKLKMEKKRKKK